MIHYLRSATPSTLRGTALLRLDFNTEDDWRLEAAIPTIRFLLKRSSKIVIVSHRGRPLGFEKKFSLKKDALKLGWYLKRRVCFIGHFRFGEIKKFVDGATTGSVFLLENLRFAKGEKMNNPAFAKRLASLGDFYVNEAFAVSHRANASVSAIAKFLPSYAGLEFEKEIEFLGGAMKNPRRPLVFVLGGGKAGDKLGVIKYFKSRADDFLLGGAAANTMLFLRGVDVKKSLIDKDENDLEELRHFLNCKNVLLPVDYKWEDNAILDVGSETVREFKKRIDKARTVIWSGPLGFIEKKQYEKGTLDLARAIVANKKAYSLAGGGETVMFLKMHKLDKKFSFVSTGGGAMLEFLAGEKLPGIKALERS